MASSPTTINSMAVHPTTNTPHSDRQVSFGALDGQFVWLLCIYSPPKLGAAGLATVGWGRRPARTGDGQPCRCRRPALAGTKSASGGLGGAAGHHTSGASGDGDEGEGHLGWCDACQEATNAELRTMWGPYRHQRGVYGCEAAPQFLNFPPHPSAASMVKPLPRACSPCHGLSGPLSGKRPGTRTATTSTAQVAGYHLTKPLGCTAHALAAACY